MPKTETAVRIELLNDSHDRAGFSCGVPALDRYFQTQVTQDIRRLIAGCYVAIARDGGELAGYYTIAASSIPLPDLAANIAKKLPRYPLVPCVRVGRLAVAAKMRGKGIGSIMLADAVHRALVSEITAFAMIVDAKDETASAFYRHHGFSPYESQPLSLHSPLASARKTLGLAPQQIRRPPLA
jgi:GNAT superfamily N-acetyltransferase